MVFSRVIIQPVCNPISEIDAQNGPVVPGGLPGTGAQTGRFVAWADPAANFYHYQEPFRKAKREFLK